MKLPPLAHVKERGRDAHTGFDALMSRAGAGDDAAFTHVWSRSSAGLRAIAKRMVMDAAAVDDVLQAALCAAYRNRECYRPECGGAFTWLSAIVRHGSIDHLRRRRRELAHHDRMQNLNAGWEGAAHSAHDDLVRSEMCSAVQSALAELPPENARAIACAFLGEMTHSEISAELRIPLGTVKARIRRGLSALRLRLVRLP